MIFDHEIVPQSIAEPNSFVGLMTLYESNYAKLNHLFPNIKQYDDDRSIKSPFGNDIQLGVNKKTKYTMIISMTYSFEESEIIEYEPNLTIKIYFDSRSAEVIGIGKLSKKNKLRDITYQNKDIINQLWRRNIILNKWLDYIIDCDYSV
ncbi:MAG: hypothetical protein CMP02_01010 [Woeseiaceae bacterium]|nr:hypothetical protein [Woeseiaceae bacterium]